MGIKQLVRDHRDAEKLTQDLKLGILGSKAGPFTKTLYRKTCSRVPASCDTQHFVLLPSLAPQGHLGSLGRCSFSSGDWLGIGTPCTCQ